MKNHWYIQSFIQSFITHMKRKPERRIINFRLSTIDLGNIMNNILWDDCNFLTIAKKRDFFLTSEKNFEKNSYFLNFNGYLKKRIKKLLLDDETVSIYKKIFNG